MGSLIGRLLGQFSKLKSDLSGFFLGVLVMATGLGIWVGIGPALTIVGAVLALFFLLI